MTLQKHFLEKCLQRIYFRKKKWPWKFKRYSQCITAILNSLSKERNVSILSDSFLPRLIWPMNLLQCKKYPHLMYSSSIHLLSVVLVETPVSGNGSHISQVSIGKQMIYSNEFNWSELNKGIIPRGVVRNRRTNKNAGVSSKEKLSSSLSLKTQGEGTELPKCDEGWSDWAQWLFPGKCWTIFSSGREKTKKAYL